MLSTNSILRRGESIAKPVHLVDVDVGVCELDFRDSIVQFPQNPDLLTQVLHRDERSSPASASSVPIPPPIPRPRSPASRVPSSPRRSPSRGTEPSPPTTTSSIARAPLATPSSATPRPRSPRSTTALESFASPRVSSPTPPRPPDTFRARTPPSSRTQPSSRAPPGPRQTSKTRPSPRAPSPARTRRPPRPSGPRRYRVSSVSANSPACSVFTASVSIVSPRPLSVLNFSDTTDDAAVDSHRGCRGCARTGRACRASCRRRRAINSPTPTRASRRSSGSARAMDDRSNPAIDIARGRSRDAREARVANGRVATPRSPKRARPHRGACE